MKRSYRTLLAAPLLLAMIGCQLPAGEDVHVVIIGVDGMSPNGIREAPTPHIDSLMAVGASSMHARGVLPTSSSPNWASMIMGAGPEQHGITSNTWEQDRHDLLPTATGLGSVFPSIFDLLARQRPGARSASIYDWDGFGRLYNRDAVDIDIDGAGPEETAEEAARVIREEAPALTFIHLDHVDHAGHELGHGSPEYNEAVAEADRLIGRVLDGIRDGGLVDRTVVIVTSDHGGIGVQHGGETMEELEIPWIAAGSGIRQGVVIDEPVDTYDTAATAAYLLGLEPPVAWIGRPVRQALEKPPAPALETSGVDGVAHVVVIGVDGMSPDGVQKARTPVLNQLIESGAYSLKARAVLTTSSSQNWSSMIMGAGPEQHGITSNGWERDSFTIPPTAEGPEGLFPTMFSELRASRPDARIVVSYDWGGFGRLYQKSSVDVDEDADGPLATVEAAVAAIDSLKPTLTFIHLDHVDHAGHSHGHGSDHYYEAVEEADALIGLVMDALETAGMRDSTLVIITADHGGRGTGHGGETMDEILIPWIANGPGVAPGTIDRPIDTFDTAPTVLHALGIEQPYAWVGRAVREAFDEGRAGVGVTYVPAPLLIPGPGAVTGEELAVVASADLEGAVIRYTVDGSDPEVSSPVADSPITLSESGVIRARAFHEETASPVTSGRYYLLKPGVPYGVRYRLYEGTWETLPDFDGLEPVRTGTGDRIALDVVEDLPDDYYGVVYTADLDIRTPGEYTFNLTSDDGSRLEIGDTVVVDKNSTGGSSASGSIQLGEGVYSLKVSYFETYGENVLIVRYEGPGVDPGPIPIDVLHPRD